MSWQIASCLGAFGGLIVSLLAFCADVKAWHRDRRKCQRTGTARPRFSNYVDPHADLLVLLTRMILGVISANIFHDPVAAAIGAGAAGPALLSQFRDDTAVLPPAAISADQGEAPERIVTAQAYLAPRAGMSGASDSDILDQVPKPRRPEAPAISPARGYVPKHLKDPQVLREEWPEYDQDAREVPQ